VNLTDHTFVRETSIDPLDLCPDCSEPWAECRCDVPEYQGAFLETFEREPNNDRRH
jgi:hypothetical protein